MPPYCLVLGSGAGIHLRSGLALATAQPGSMAMSMAGSSKRSPQPDALPQHRDPLEHLPLWSPGWKAPPVSARGRSKRASAGRLVERVNGMAQALRLLFAGDLTGLTGLPRKANKKEEGEAKGMDKDIWGRLQMAAAVAEEEKIYSMDPEFAWERLTKTRQHAGQYGMDVLEGNDGERVPEKGEVVLASSGVIALPPVGLKPIDMSAFSPRVAHYADNYRQKMLKSSTEVDWAQVAQTRAYMDPGLRSKAGMLNLAVEMWLRGMLRYVDHVRAHVSMFTVMKKVLEDGQWSLRLIMDLRFVNLFFEEPPPVVLGSPAALAEMELSPEVRQGA